MKVAIFALVAAQATAGQGTQLDPVTVEGERRRERIHREVSEFVDSVAGAARAESLARWKVPVCAIAVGLPAGEAGFVGKRVSQVAADADNPVGGEGCAPNFVVVFTPEPEKFLKEWWAEDHGLFNRDRGLGGVNRMIRTDQPVRIWHNACNIPPLRGYYEPSGQLNCGVGVTGSRLTHAAVRAIYSAIVVVDLDRVECLTFGQLADYAAMVGLAKTRPNPELGEASTILGLFTAAADERPKGLTTWDQSFLKAIYSTTDGSVTEVTQVKLKMSEELAR